MATSTRKPGSRLPSMPVQRKIGDTNYSKTLTVSVVPPGSDVQEAPVSFRLGTESLATFKVDGVTFRGRRRLRIEGWAIGPLSMQLLVDGSVVDCINTRINRPDVAEEMGVAEGDEGHGWVLLSEAVPSSGKSEWTLKIILDHPNITSTHLFRLKVEKANSESSALSAFKPLGTLEGVVISAVAGMSVVAGWALLPSGAPLWLEQDGEYHDLESDEASIRFMRQDVMDMHGAYYGGFAIGAGFIALIEELTPNRPVNLVTALGDEYFTLSTIQATALSVDPVAVSRWLFGFSTPTHQLAERFAKVDMHVLQPLLANQRAYEAGLGVEIRQLGTSLARPAVSMIVPVYGRYDFIEHQLMEFVQDPWITANVELVYVIDDPKLIQGFYQQAEVWHRLYRLPFKWLWGGENRGFSGANNLGAAHSNGNALLFMNSDAFPQQPGWLQILLDALQSHPTFGAVAPRLVFGDGSMQHAGMEFVRRDELGIWINHHPRVGLDPALDPLKHIAPVPAITGACLLIERETFGRIGGWDTSYLVGDFEDSDLCLKLLTEGLLVGYVPNVQLTHLERQSFKFLGQDDWRQKVVVFNAVRHQSRWAAALIELASTN